MPTNQNQAMLNTQVQQLTQPFTFLQEMDLVLQVQKAIAGNQGPIAIGIRHCIECKTPNDKILREIKEMANDNYPMIARVIGENLLCTIINFK